MTGPLDEERLAGMAGRIPGVARVVVLGETGSTNADLRRLADAGALAGTVVVAASQTAGRGRLGRTWHSPAGSGLYLSVLLRSRRPAAEAGRFTLAAATAGAEACARAGAGEVRVKWPNDLHWRGRKVAGFLAEARAQGDAREIVLGAGFNVGPLPSSFPAEIPAASLREAGARDLTREDLAESFLEGFLGFASELERGRWEAVARRFLDRAAGVEGGRVRVDPGAGPWEGTTRGIDDFGALRVERDDGTVEVVRLGEAVTPLPA